MRHNNQKSHDALQSVWNMNAFTPVFFWILCSWLPCLTDWQVSCSGYVVQLQQNICHQNDFFSSSRMRVMNHNWSDMKQPQSVAEISRNSVLWNNSEPQWQSTFFPKRTWGSEHRLNVAVVCTLQSCGFVVFWRSFKIIPNPTVWSLNVLEMSLDLILDITGTASFSVWAHHVSVCQRWCPPLHLH